MIFIHLLFIFSLSIRGLSSQILPTHQPLSLLNHPNDIDQSFSSHPQTAGNDSSSSSLSSSTTPSTVSESNCAFRIRFLPSAIQYLNQIASQIIAQQLPRIRIPNVVHRLANDQGLIVVSRIRVSRFKRASLHTISTNQPNRLVWRMQNFNIGFLGDLSGELRILLPLALEGQAEVQAQGVDFRLESALERWANGSAHLRTISCQTTIKALDVENYNGGLTGVALNIFKTATSNLIRPIIQTEVCRKVRKFIDETLNEKLAETQTKSSFARRNYEKSSRSYMDESDDEFQVVNNLEKNSHISNYLFSEQLAKQTFIDFRLTEDPVCYTNTIELANLGNVSIGNETSETPFGIPSLRWPSLANRNDSMVDLIISDYVPNALLYHAYKKTTESDMTHRSIVLNVIETNLLKRQRFGGCCSERLLNFKIDESNSPSMSSFLRTKCSSGSVCLADMLPQLTDRYPNNKLELLIAAINPPSIVFSSDNDGTVLLKSNGLISVNVINVDESPEEAIVFDVDLVANAYLHVQNSAVIGRITLTKFRLKKTSGEIDIPNEEVSDLALLGAEMLEKYVNSMFKTGLPLPLPEVIHLNSSDLQIFDRYVLLSSHFTVDRHRLNDIAADTMSYHQKPSEVRHWQ